MSKFTERLGASLAGVIAMGMTMIPPTATVYADNIPAPTIIQVKNTNTVIVYDAAAKNVDSTSNPDDKPFFDIYYYSNGQYQIVQSYEAYDGSGYLMMNLYQNGKYAVAVQYGENGAPGPLSYFSITHAKDNNSLLDYGSIVTNEDDQDKQVPQTVGVNFQSHPLIWVSYKGEEYKLKKGQNITYRMYYLDNNGVMHLLAKKTVKSGWADASFMEPKQRFLAFTYSFNGGKESAYTLALLSSNGDGTVLPVFTTANY